MKAKASLKKNALYNMVYQILVIITPLITSPYLSRILGAEGMGTFSYAQSISNYFFLFAMLGVNNYGNRSIAQVQDNRKLLSHTFWQIYYMQMFQAVLYVALYYMFCLSFIPSETRLIYLIQGLQVVSVFVDTNWFAFGMEQFRFVTYRNIFVKIFTVISIFTFVRTTEDLWKYTLIIGTGTIISLLMIWPSILHETDFEWPQWASIKSHIKPNFVLFVPYLASSVYQYMDKVMLGSMINVTEVGYYTYAENILNVPLSLVNGLCTVFMPRISNMRANNQEDKANNLLDRAIHYSTILDVALCFGIIAIAPVFVPFYLGENYTRSANLLMLLAVIVPILGWASIIRMMYLIPCEKDSVYVSAVATGAVVNFVGNLLMIKPCGAYGACVATILAQLAVLFVQIFNTRHELPYGHWIKRALPYILFGGIMCLFVQYITDYFEMPIFKMLIGIACGAFLYSLLSGLFLCVVERDAMIKKGIERWRK